MLKLHPASQVGLSPDRKVQIFGAFKDSLYDRQIGDGRRQNGYESRIPGPSKDLPTAALLTRLQVAPSTGSRSASPTELIFTTKSESPMNEAKRTAYGQPSALEISRAQRPMLRFLQRR